MNRTCLGALNRVLALISTKTSEKTLFGVLNGSRTENLPLF